MIYNTKFCKKSNHLQELSADLVTFTEETLNGKLQFLCSDISPLDILNHGRKQ